MSEGNGEPKSHPHGRKPMEINLDRPSRVRGAILYVALLLAVGGGFAWLLMRFTGSKLIAFGLAGGMLAYMLVASFWTARNLRGPDA